MAEERWKACIVGDELFLRDLARVLDADPCRVTQGDDGYIVEGDLFIDCTSEQQCYSIASQWLESLNGATALLGGNVEPIVLSYVMALAGNGTRHSFTLVDEAILIRDSCRTTVVRGDGTTEDSFPAEVVPELLAAGAAAPEVGKILRLIGKRECTWAQLYSIFEIVRASAGGDGALIAAGWLSKDTQSRFTRSANHPEIAGDGARHGVSSSQPPRHPMDLNEAKAVIHALVLNWIKR